LPVIVFMHGIGEKGIGNQTDLQRLYNNGIPKLIKAGRWVTISKDRFIVLAPQNSNGFFNADNLKKYIANMITKYNADPDRIYLVGISAGGISIWNYLNKYNNQVAAVIPIAGNGNQVSANACYFKDVPLWAFHGDADTQVNCGGSINPVNKMNSCVPKPAPLAKITIYPGCGHDSWSRTLDLSAGHQIYDWLLSFTLGE
jgi:predicted peptidase